MFRFGLAVTVLALGSAAPLGAVELAPAAPRGDYLESRTCDVFTGPCFANAEVGLAGKEAILAWSIDSGAYQGVDLSGLKVVLAVQGSDTLGFGGRLNVNPRDLRTVVLVDQRATPLEREALVAFATEQAGEAAGNVVRIAPAAIEMQVDHVDMVARLTAGGEVTVETRKLGGHDCVCTNETVFYPPLARVENYEPAYTVEGRFAGRGLGAQWTHPKSRSAFLATFGQ